MTLLAGAVSLIPLWALGFATQLALGIRGNSVSAFALDYVIGVTLLAFVGSITVVAGSTPPVWSIYLLLIGMGALAWRRQRSGSHQDAAAPLAAPSNGRYTRLFGIGIIAVLLFLSATALTDRLTWDGWTMWAFRARMLFYEGAFPADAFDKPGPYEYTHPEYPLALPLLNWWVYRHAGEPAQALTSFVGSVWVAALAAVAWSTLRARVDASIATLAVLALVLFRPMSEHTIGGTGEAVMALAFLGVVSEVQFADTANSDVAHTRAGFYLALAVLAKNEGLALAVLVVLALGLTGPRALLRPRTVAAFGLPVMLGVTWYLYTRTFGLEVEQIGGFPPPDQWLQRAVMIAATLGGFAIYRSWPPIILLGLLGAVVWLRRRPARAEYFGPLMIIGYLIVLVAVYFSTTQDLDWLLRTSDDRVLTHMIPTVLVLAVVAIWRSPVPSPAIDQPATPQIA